MQGILSWQEIAPGPETEHFISMLGHTIRLYLSWDLNDQNIFKILRFLAAGFHKVPETFNIERNENVHANVTACINNSQILKLKDS